jgi:leader peptidase (prepilin peptidase)/N-methyltransferase
MTFLFGVPSVTMIVAAPFVGCFGANAVRRSLEGKGFLFERSCCDACGRRLELRDLIPVLSWLFQGGRCRACSAPISLLYPAVEAGFLLIALWAAYAQPDLLVPSLLLGWVLLILIAFDMLAFILPNALTLSLGLSGLLLAASEGHGELQESALGLIAGGASLLLVRVLYEATRGREGLGLGDIKLFAAAGAWVKLEGLPSVLLIGSSLGLFYALFAFRRALRDAALKKVPLGAGLCGGFWLTWVYGPVFDWSLGAIFSPGTSS